MKVRLTVYCYAALGRDAREAWERWPFAEVLWHVEAHRLNRYYTALPVIEAMLSQMNWESAAKGESKLSAKALMLKEQARRAYLAPFAPNHILNKMAAGQKATAKPYAALSPEACRGLIKWFKTHHHDNSLWLMIVKDIPGIQARAGRG